MGPWLVFHRVFVVPAPIANSPSMTQKRPVESVGAVFGIQGLSTDQSDSTASTGALGVDTRLASLARRGTRGGCVRRLGREASEVAPSMMRCMFR
jgi:hypothetical protein